MTGALPRVAAFWALLGGLALLAIIAATLTNVGAFALDRLARPLGGSVAGLPGYEDFVQVAVAGAAFSFLPWCQMRRGHVTAALFASRMSTALSRALDRLWLGATAALAWFLAWMMALGMAEARADGALTPVLGWPEWPFHGPGVASLALWGLAAAAQAMARPAAGSGPFAAARPHG